VAVVVRLADYTWLRCLCLVLFALCALSAAETTAINKRFYQKPRGIFAGLFYFTWV
jgi:hypothetical protein